MPRSNVLSVIPLCIGVLSRALPSGPSRSDVERARITSILAKSCVKASELFLFVSDIEDGIGDGTMLLVLISDTFKDISFGTSYSLLVFINRYAKKIIDKM